MTKDSVNIIKEYRNYLWMKDRDGKVLNEPEHEFSHSVDAIRYAFSTIQSMAPKDRKPVIMSRRPLSFSTGY